ncbi:hypothetical protein ACIGN6_02485 [Streptomyces sp. NPDC053792]|uniref:hypothetical protein n=1 Tax=Streptomyces sp. NPDC053792 TaxID=3365716 RepID=UPI0037CCC80B
MSYGRVSSCPLVGEATARAHQPVRFHFFTGVLAREREAVEAALRASGIVFTSLQPEADAPCVEGLLTGTSEGALLARTLLALRDALRQGLLVRSSGPDELVIRNDGQVPQGLVLVRLRSRALRARDAAGLHGALSDALEEAARTAVVREGAPYAASAMFDGAQNTELAGQAVRLMRVFADPDFVGRADPNSDRLADPARLAAANSGPRDVLDMLLLAHGMSPAVGMTAAAEVASRVEVFLLLSTAVESRRLTLPLSGGDGGFALGLPAITSEMMANLSWVIPALIGLACGQESWGGPRDGARGPRRHEMWSEVDDCLASYLRNRRPRHSSEPLPAPRPLIPMSMPDGEAPYGPGDPFVVFNACNMFLLARELVPLLPDRSEGGVGAFESFLAPGLPREVRQEVWTDCKAYMLTMNALILRSGDREPYIPDFDNIERHLQPRAGSVFARNRRLHERAQQDADLLVRCMHRTTEALLSYYAVADILAASARADGLTGLARGLEAVAERREPVCEFVLGIKRRHLPRAWGFRTWHEDEEAHWQALQEYVRHVQLDVVPGMGRN